jgi:hypothetical protein
MERTSSPTTYSRSESNSLPGPRSSDRCCPSSSRSRDSFSGRCRRLRNGGSARTDHAAGRLPCRAARPIGPNERIVTVAATASPRRRGVSDVVRVARPPPGNLTGACRGAAPALGGHASRTMARSGRRPGFSIVTVTDAVSPSRTLVSPARVTRSGRTGAASSRSATIPAASRPSTTTSAAAVRSPRTTRTPASASAAARPVSATAGYRGTGTEASTPSSMPSGDAPSSSASGRSWTRCRNVGRARAFTSSGVT